MRVRCCTMPGCNNPAYDHWDMRMCALPDIGLTRMYLCAKHDVELNEAMARFVFGDRYEAELAQYRYFMLSRYHAPLLIEQRSERVASGKQPWFPLIRASWHYLWVMICINRQCHQPGFSWARCDVAKLYKQHAWERWG